MNGVIGMNELLLGTELDAEQREYAEQVARSSEHMMTIIDDILDTAKIEQGTVRLSLADFDLLDVVEQACLAPRLGAQAKAVRLRVQVDPGVQRRAYGDAPRIRQILTNLVQNAVKFTDAGEVALSVSQARGEVRFQVRDTGIGIDPAQLDRMFEPFIQADPTTTRRHGGNGLGLAISKELVQRMGGRIGAESRPGRGSTFWFTIPLAGHEARPQRPERAPATCEHQFEVRENAGRVAHAGPDGTANGTFTTGTLGA